MRHPIATTNLAVQDQTRRRAVQGTPEAPSTTRPIVAMEQHKALINLREPPGRRHYKRNSIAKMPSEELCVKWTIDALNSLCWRPSRASSLMTTKTTHCPQLQREPFKTGLSTQWWPRRLRGLSTGAWRWETPLLRFFQITLMRNPLVISLDMLTRPMFTLKLTQRLDAPCIISTENTRTNGIKWNYTMSQSLRWQVCADNSDLFS